MNDTEKMMLQDLRLGARKAGRERDCPLCAYIQRLPEGELRDTLTTLGAGIIGTEALAKIMSRYGTGVGRRTIMRHRAEEHRP